MKNCVYLVLIAYSSFALASQASREDLPETPPPSLRHQALIPVDWAQPPLGCVEEMVPRPSPDRPCLELTKVASPLKDWPADLPPDDQQYWYGHRRALTYCRAEEVLRREALQPGSQSAGALETSWMVDISIQHYDDKVNALYEANQLYGVPVHVLTGAVYQESMFAELGISEDGGNFSCGVEQINLNGWCEWTNTRPVKERRQMGWPVTTIDCENETLTSLELIRPFYEIAKTRLSGWPEYRLQKEHFQNIQLSDVVGAWPAASRTVQNLRYNIVTSFINNCSDPARGILAKGHELQMIYTSSVSKAFKNKDRYLKGDHFQRQCLKAYLGSAYPLHTGWLMSVAAYNAGPRSIDATAFYNRWSKADFNNSKVIQNFTPTDLVRSIYWSGQYNASTDLIDFTMMSGRKRSWQWFTECVNQRHVARVMQNVTLLPEYFVDSLEGDYPCARSVFQDGKLVQSGVPPFRQTSSGVK